MVPALLWIFWKWPRFGGFVIIRGPLPRLFCQMNVNGMCDTHYYLLLMCAFDWHRYFRLFGHWALCANDSLFSRCQLPKSMNNNWNEWENTVSGCRKEEDGNVLTRFGFIETKTAPEALKINLLFLVGFDFNKRAPTDFLTIIRSSSIHPNTTRTQPRYGHKTIYRSHRTHFEHKLNLNLVADKKLLSKINKIGMSRTKLNQAMRGTARKICPFHFAVEMFTFRYYTSLYMVNQNT